MTVAGIQETHALNTRWLPGENQDAVCGQDEAGGVPKTMKRLRVGQDAAVIARHAGIDPIFIHIAVEHFTPGSLARQADLISDTSEVGQVQNDHHVLTFPLHPTMEGQHPILVMHMGRTEPTAALCRQETA